MVLVKASRFAIGLIALTLVGCATGKCPNSKPAGAGTSGGSSGTTGASATTTAGASTSAGGNTAPAKEIMKPESKLDRVKVFKADGSLQCGQGKAIPAADMQKELGDIKVYSSATKNDGMMRIQVCGSPTGTSNVYEIDRKNLEAAIKKGFKEWTFDN